MRIQPFARTVHIIEALVVLFILNSSLGCSRDPNILKKKYLESGNRYAAEGKQKEAYIQFSNALRIDRNYGDAHYALAKTYIKLGSMQAAFSELLHTVDIQPNNIQARIDLGNMLLAGGESSKAAEQAKAVLAIQNNNADAYALLSSIAASNGDHTEAISQINKALSIDPHRASFHLALGLIEASDKNSLGMAENELNTAISIDPKNVTAHLVLAMLLENSGNVKDAELQDKAAVDADPSDIQARTSLAQLYLHQGDNSKAEEVLRKGTESLAYNTKGASLLEAYYLQTNQYSRAESSYSDLVYKYPKSVPLKLAYAQIFLAQGNTEKAESIVAPLLKSNKNDPDVDMLQGILLLRAGKVNESYDALKNAERNSPENINIILWLARAAYAKGDTNTAEKNFLDATHLDPSSLEAQEGLAQLSSQQGNYSMLAQVANNTLAVHPDYSNAYLWRGTSEADQKQYDKADSDFQQAIKLDNNNTNAYVELGQLRLSQGHGAEGISLLENALKHSPESAHALRLLSSYYVYIKQPYKAIARIKQQIAISPQNSSMYDDLAETQLETGDASDAVTASEKAMQLNPADGTALLNYTRSQILLGNTGNAITIWQAWIKNHPSSSQAYTVLGTLEQAQGDQNKATEYYQKALQIQPDQAVASNNLACLILDSGGNIDYAYSLAQTARRAMPDSPSTADTLAWAYYHKGLYDSARDLLEDALKTSPGDPTIHYHLGMTYIKMSDKSNAVIQLKKAASLSPKALVAKSANQALDGLL